MKLLLTLLFSLYSAIAISQKDTVIIRGSLERLSTSQRVHILQDWGNNLKGLVKDDGSFEITGTVSKAHLVYIKTDSSATDGIWLEPGSYTIVCKEIKYPGIDAFLFRIPVLNGPEDAMIFNKFSQRRYELKFEERKQFEFDYVDSIIKTKPQAKCIVEMLRKAEYSIGIAKVDSLLEQLPESDDKSKYKADLERKKTSANKIETEKYFSDFSMPQLNGKIFNLHDLKAKIILIDFWASWCTPCRAGNPHLVSLYQKFHNKGFEIVSISLDDNRKNWIKAIAKDKMKWINVSELNGLDNSLAKSYFITGVPTYIWLDANRKIFSKGLTEQALEDLLNK